MMLREKLQTKQAKIVFGIVIVLLSILILVGVVVLRMRSGNDLDTIAGEVDVLGLVSEVNELIKLPDEEPTVATVADLEKLQGQTFFDDAQVGDRVLIFAQARKAYLYRPSDHRLIEVAPVVISEDASESASIDTTEISTIPSESDIQGFVSEQP